MVHKVLLLGFKTPTGDLNRDAQMRPQARNIYFGNTYDVIFNQIIVLISWPSVPFLMLGIPETRYSVFSPHHTTGPTEHISIKAISMQL